MATRRAIANGNWSATATWNGGVVPTNGDTVYANGFNITLNVDVLIGGANNPIVNTGSLVSGQWYEIVNVGGQNWTTVGAASNTTGTVFQSSGTGTAGNLGTALALATLTTATNTAAGATTGGGVFTMSTVRAMTADLRAGTTTCLNVTATSGTLTLSGVRVAGGTSVSAVALNNNSAAIIELLSGTFIGGSAAQAAAISNNTGIINVTGPCVFAAVGSSGWALNNGGGGTINVSGSCAFWGGSSTNSWALNNASNGIINVSGSCTFTGGSSGVSPSALNNNSIGTINVSGSCTFNGGQAAPAISSASTGTLVVSNSTFAASAFVNAVIISNPAADIRLSGDFFDHWSGWKSVSGTKWRLGTAPTLGQTRYALEGTTDSYYTMYGADNGAFGNPVAANVRSGIVYGGGNLTGKCAVPAAGSVALGVPVDAGYGTAVLTPADVWGALTNDFITSGSIGERLKNVSTVATTGEQLATALTPP